MCHMTIDVNHFKNLLEKEKETLESELKSIGRVNPDNPKDWQATPQKMDILKADENEVADSIERFEENTAILKQLEIRINEVKGALERIKNNTYGKCEVGGEEIEKERLEANPAATTCIKHLE